MKKIMKKNQLIVTTLAIMIAVAGYLTFSSDIKKNKNPNTELVNSNGVNSEALPLTEEETDITWNEDDIEVLGEDDSSDIVSDSTPGEAVLTESSSVIASAKLSKEQVRSQTEESLTAIVNNSNLSEAEKSAAVNKLVEIAENSENEIAAETLLQAKGFSNVMVSITDESVDVVVYAENLTDAQLAQIADIVKRKTGVSSDKIVITPVGSSDNNE